ncbi:M13 family metallopeptidase [Archangium primigenium]|uniref:M13 family metallopeptidase n=1 Tax=[Archangium] primigenium TaxID=2792470 RepID=UPI001957071F|nr:M13 family metallopeptidase [Archangium primigenium]MBM7118141.1 M13 family metallopeptidase [Archangium primigenium]
MTSPFRRFPGATRVALTLGTSAWLAGCATTAPADTASALTRPDKPAATPPAPAPRPTYGAFGVDTSGMSPSVTPGNDFFRYANGQWFDRTEIPADQSSIGMFSQLAREADRRTREIIEEAARSDAPAGSELRKLGDLYASFMDEAAIEARGLTPLAPELQRIGAIADRRQLAAALGDTLRADVDALNMGRVTTDRLFGLWVSEDLNEPSRYAAYLFQGGLGLPDRDYYLSEDPKFAEVRQKYEKHVAALLRLAGGAEPEAQARRVVALERSIARVHWSQVDTRDVAKANNPWPRAQFAQRAPGLDWDTWFSAAGLGQQREFIVWQPSALTGIAKLVGGEPLQTWKDYLTFHALARAAPFLSRAFSEESFAFHGQVLSGLERQRPRWERAVSITGEAMGEAIGKRYVAKYFPPEAKAEADTMVRDIIAALDRRIDALAWMAPETKARAKEKLTTLQVGIGHPEKWRDYTGLEIRAGDAYGNHERASRFETQRHLKKLGGPVDRAEWFMVPQLVNALNSPQQNSIIFPAAILQPPFFDPNADPAVNYAAIGAVIGHEIVHSFDDVGAQFDARGKLANWWTKEDAARFKAAGQALVAQYNAYRPLPDASVNGELTLGENIADLAGLAIAHDAYTMSRGGKETPAIEGFTGDQRFFLGFAQIWRRKYREPSLRRALLTDGHAPSEFRVLTVRNLEPWYQAFGVTPGQTLYLTPEQRVRVW